MEKIETNDILDNLGKLFEQQLSEIKKLKTQNDTLVWSTDILAATETGLGRTLFERVKHKLPHITIVDDNTGAEKNVYPKQAVKDWLDSHTEVYGK